MCGSINFMNYREQRCVISKQFAFILVFFDKSLIYNKNNKGPKMDTCGTPARISAKDKHWAFKTTLCFLSLRRPSKILIISPQIPFWRSLKISPSYHALSKALEISRNIPRTSSPIPKALKILCLIEKVDWWKNLLVWIQIDLEKVDSS